MSFVTAWLAVAGLAAMAVPILIHLLLRRRREPVPWAAMRLLRQALREQSRRLRLEQLLVLALRCLILVAVGAAAAQPLLRGGSVLDGGRGRTILLIVDDGLLAGLRREGAAAGGSALENQVDVARSILDSLGAGDSVGIIGAAHPARGLLLPPTSAPAAAAALLRTLAPADAPTDLAGAFALLRETIDRLPEDRPILVFLLSEFRRGSAPLDSPLEPLLAQAMESSGRRVELLTVLPAEEMVDNVQVLAVEPLRRLLLPGQSDGSGQISVRLRRFGTMPEGQTQVRLSTPALPIDVVRSARWEEGRSETAVEFLLEGDSLTGSSRDDASERRVDSRSALGATVQVDQDAVPGDDRRSTVLQTRRAVRVALLDRRAFGAGPGLERLSAGQWLGRALRPSDMAPIDVTIEDPARIDGRTLRGVDAAVVARPDLLEAEGWREIIELLERGGLVMVIPPGEQRVHGWLDRLAAQLDLPWRPELEAIDLPEPLPLAERQPATPLLRLLEAELPDLASPVRIFRRLPVDLSASPADAVLNAADGGAVILAAAPRRAPEDSAAGAAPGQKERRGEPLSGLLVLWTVAPELEWTDLPIRPAMVPLVQELIRQGIGLGGGSSEGVVGDQIAVGSAAAELLRIDDRSITRTPGVTPGVTRGVTPGSTLGSSDPGVDPGAQTSSESVPVRGGRSAAIERAGLHQVVDASGLELGIVAVNIEPDAGDPSPQSAEAVLAWLRGSGPWTTVDAAEPAAALREVQRSSALSGALLVIALVAALLECYFARRFSHASASSALAAHSRELDLAPRAAEARR
jgi:hypothetical protein